MRQSDGQICCSDTCIGRPGDGFNQLNSACSPLRDMPEQKPSKHCCIEGSRNFRESDGIQLGAGTGLEYSRQILYQKASAVLRRKTYHQKYHPTRHATVLRPMAFASNPIFSAIPTRLTTTCRKTNAEPRSGPIAAADTGISSWHSTALDRPHWKINAAKQIVRNTHKKTTSEVDTLIDTVG